MTADPSPTASTRGAVSVRELAGMLQEATGESEQWAARITPATRLEDDLLLESMEYAALGELIRRRHGDRFDLVEFLAGLDLDELLALTIGDLCSYLPAPEPV